MILENFILNIVVKKHLILEHLIFNTAFWLYIGSQKKKAGSRVAPVMVVLDHVSEESKNNKSEHRLRLLEQTSEASHADGEERRRRRGTGAVFWSRHHRAFVYTEIRRLKSKTRSMALAIAC